MKIFESALAERLRSFDLSDARIVAITGLSRHFHEAVGKYLEDFYVNKNFRVVHIYCYYSTEGKLPQSIKLGGQKVSALKDLLNRDHIAIFFHDVDDLGSVSGFTSLVRGTLEKSSSSSVVILTMRPATAFRVYTSGRSPLFGRVMRLEEPLVNELGISGRVAEASGYMDLYRALIFDGVNAMEDFEVMVPSEGSVTFGVLERFWNVLLTDSRRAGLCKVIASCLAAHDNPLRLPVIAEKCGLKQSVVRVLVYSANKTALLKIGGSKKGRFAQIYPPLLHKWIRENVPFYPKMRG